MAYRVKIMPRAQRDLAHIFTWIGTPGSQAAAAWYGGLKDAIAALRTNPQRCPVTPESRELRHLLYGRKPHVYRVVFRIVEKHKQVEILTIHHGARDRFKAAAL